MKKYLPFILLFIGAASIWFIKSHQRGSELPPITIDTGLNDNRPLVAPPERDSIGKVVGPDHK